MGGNIGKKSPARTYAGGKCRWQFHTWDTDPKLTPLATGSLSPTTVLYYKRTGWRAAANHRRVDCERRSERSLDIVPFFRCGGWLLSGFQGFKAVGICRSHDLSVWWIQSELGRFVDGRAHVWQCIVRDRVRYTHFAFGIMLRDTFSLDLRE